MRGAKASISDEMTTGHSCLSIDRAKLSTDIFAKSSSSPTSSSSCTSEEKLRYIDHRLPQDTTIEVKYDIVTAYTILPYINWCQIIHTLLLWLICVT